MLSNPEIDNRRARIDWQVQLVEQFLGATEERLPINDPQPARRAAEKDILGHAEVLHQRKLLINDGDARLFRVSHAGEVPFGAIKNNLAAIFGVRINAGKDLDQSRFAGAVFTDERVDFALPKIKAHAVQGSHAWKDLGDALHFQKARGHRL